MQIAQHGSSCWGDTLFIGLERLDLINISGKSHTPAVTTVGYIDTVVARPAKETYISVSLHCPSQESKGTLVGLTDKSYPSSAEASRLAEATKRTA